MYMMWGRQMNNTYISSDYAKAYLSHSTHLYKNLDELLSTIPDEDARDSLRRRAFALWESIDTYESYDVYEVMGCILDAFYSWIEECEGSNE